MDSFIRLGCLIPASDEEHLAGALATVSTLGAWLQPQGDGLVGVAVYLDPARPAEAEALEAELRRMGARNVRRESVAAGDWLATYRRAAQPFTVGGRWWIDPRPDGSGPVPEGRIRLRVEPSTAFGSGSHESTQLVLTAMESLPLAGTAVLDLGSGSGILAVAATALDARLVLALDIDPQAAWVARRTCMHQDWLARPELVIGDVASVAGGRFDVVLCNILTRALRPLLPRIHDRLVTGGHAILAGMLGSELAEMTHAAARSRLEVRREWTLGEWGALEVERG